MDKYAKQNSSKLTGSENFKQKHKKLKIKVRDKSITTRIQKIIIEVRQHNRIDPNAPQAYHLAS